MARDFSKNTSNSMSLGVSGIASLLSGAAKISVHAWVLADTLTNSGTGNLALNVMIDGISQGLALHLRGFAGNTGAVRVAARSVAGDASQGAQGSTTINSGVWLSIGGVVDIPGDIIRVYLNGVQDGSAAVTFANATWTLGTPTGADSIGGFNIPPNNTTNQFDGRIAEVAVWTDDIGTNNFLALSLGRLAAFVRPDALTAYLPLWGLHSPEIEWKSNKQGTIAGSVPAANHAPVVPFSAWQWGQMPSGVFVPAVGGTASRRLLMGVG